MTMTRQLPSGAAPLSRHGFVLYKQQTTRREKVHLLISVKFRMENEALSSVYSEPETISIKQKIKMP